MKLQNSTGAQEESSYRLTTNERLPESYREHEFVIQQAHYRAQKILYGFTLEDNLWSVDSNNQFKYNLSHLERAANQKARRIHIVRSRLIDQRSRQVQSDILKPVQSERLRVASAPILLSPHYFTSSATPNAVKSGQDLTPNALKGGQDLTLNALKGIQEFRVPRIRCGSEPMISDYRYPKHSLPGSQGVKETTVTHHDKHSSGSPHFNALNMSQSPHSSEKSVKDMKKVKKPDYMERIERICDLQMTQKPPPKHVDKFKGKKDKARDALDGARDRAREGSHERHESRRTPTDQSVKEGEESDVHVILTEKLGRPKYKSSES